MKHNQSEITGVNSQKCLAVRWGRILRREHSEEARYSGVFYGTDQNLSLPLVIYLSTIS
jgi:hypothetical protein